MVILWAYGPSFHAAVVPMLVILPGVFFFGLGSVIGGDLGGRGRPGLSSGLAGCAALVTVALDLVLIPPFGVMGAAVASVIAYTTFGVASLVALSRVSEIPLAEMLPRRADLVSYLLVLRKLCGRVRVAVGRAS
jgi:O-antigen/teichoic acid export membrane protein